MFPETAGRTLEEVEEIFNQGHVFTAWNIKRDVGKKTLQDVKAGHKEAVVPVRVLDCRCPQFKLTARYQEHDSTHKASEEHHEKV
jgi:hypothetical protein